MVDFMPHLIYAIAGFLAFKIFISMTRDHERATWKRLNRKLRDDLSRQAREEAKQREAEKEAREKLEKEASKAA
ncbi:hypothetical protein [Stratiformator vulcanicus]|uniref:Uncharacterized protein n=1 Tax=Stratiformator vulcanicus TaxID=2527980 RepID=A0A517R051_9PLAN|nr:hypothetical protein [Stratiformator vulcanicus]QDT37275.1 hypothetical protein Pan189_16480 [Stratiformator vulcanicus]